MKEETKSIKCVNDRHQWLLVIYNSRQNVLAVSFFVSQENLLIFSDTKTSWGYKRVKKYGEYL